MKIFLCQEGSELFTIEAESLEQARQDVAIWNAVVIEEVKEEVAGNSCVETN